MVCHAVKLADGVAIVCSRSRRGAKPRPCSVCAKADATRLCDHPVRPGKTCDAPLCDDCGHKLGDDRDACPAHGAQGRLF